MREKLHVENFSRGEARREPREGSELGDQRGADEPYARQRIRARGGRGGIDGGEIGERCGFTATCSRRDRRRVDRMEQARRRHRGRGARAAERLVDRRAQIVQHRAANEGCEFGPGDQFATRSGDRGDFPRGELDRRERGRLHRNRRALADPSAGQRLPAPRRGMLDRLDADRQNRNLVEQRAEQRGHPQLIDNLARPACRRDCPPIRARSSTRDLPRPASPCENSGSRNRLRT